MSLNGKTGKGNNMRKLFIIGFLLATWGAIHYIGVNWYAFAAFGFVWAAFGTLIIQGIGGEGRLRSS